MNLPANGATGSTAPALAGGHGPVRKQLWFWVLIAIVSGILFGLLFKDLAIQTKWLADAFLQLVKTIAAPVIFLTVVVGIASLGNMRKAGSLAGRALGYFFVATVVALALGLVVGNLVQPGAGLHATASSTELATAQERIAEAGESETGVTGFILGHLLPTSFVEPFAENEILRVLFLSLLTAFAVAQLPVKLRTTTISVLEAMSSIVFGIIRYIMWVSPLAAFGGMAYTVANFGSGTIGNLLTLMASFWATVAFFVFVVLNIVCRAFGFSLLKLLRLVKDEILIVLGTSSSETVLPRLLAKFERAGVAKETVGVVLPAGYSFNLDGTAIYMTLGALFVVQATGQEMPIEQQIALAALMMLTSKGAAAVSGGSLIAFIASLQTFGGEFFTAETVAVGIALVVGIDRIMSEGRALTNMIGNSVATVVVAKLCGDLEEERFRACLDDPGLIDIDHVPAPDELDEPAAPPATIAPQREPVGSAV